MKPPKQKGYIKSSIVILIAFATLFFSRVLDTLGVPAAINFLHFVTIPFALVTVVAQSRLKNRRQKDVVLLLLSGSFSLLVLILISALWNNAGIVNAILSFLLLCEPFLILTAIMTLPIGSSSLETARTWFHRFMFAHIGVALVQRYILRMHLWKGRGLVGGDYIQGLFYKSGAGHVVGASVSFTFGIYYFVSAKDKPLWIRSLVLALSFWHVITADAKQVLLCFGIAGILLLLTKARDLLQAGQYLIMGVVLGGALWWCIQNLEAFSAFTVWMRPELYGPDGNATIAKLTAFRVIPQHYTSVVNWFIGLGPGHTVGRLGGWMLHEYSSLLEPLGSTVHPASFAVWGDVGTNRQVLHLVKSSSMFSPLFGWAGIWGDLGLLGVASYLTLGAITWKFVCVDDAGRFFLLTVIVFGFIFTQMEEPGYTVTIAALLGLRWQQAKTEQQKKLATRDRLKPFSAKTTVLPEQHSST